MSRCLGLGLGVGLESLTNAMFNMLVGCTARRGAYVMVKPAALGQRVCLEWSEIDHDLPYPPCFITFFLWCEEILTRGRGGHEFAWVVTPSIINSLSRRGLAHYID